MQRFTALHPRPAPQAPAFQHFWQRHGAHLLELLQAGAQPRLARLQVHLQVGLVHAERRRRLGGKPDGALLRGARQRLRKGGKHLCQRRCRDPAARLGRQVHLRVAHRAAHRRQPLGRGRRLWQGLQAAAQPVEQLLADLVLVHVRAPAAGGAAPAPLHLRVGRLYRLLGLTRRPRQRALRLPPLQREPVHVQYFVACGVRAHRAGEGRASPLGRRSGRAIEQISPFVVFRIRASATFPCARHVAIAHHIFFAGHPRGLRPRWRDTANPHLDMQHLLGVRRSRRLRHDRVGWYVNKIMSVHSCGRVCGNVCATVAFLTCQLVPRRGLPAGSPAVYFIIPRHYCCPGSQESLVRPASLPRPAPLPSCGPARAHDTQRDQPAVYSAASRCSSRRRQGAQHSLAPGHPL